MHRSKTDYSIISSARASSDGGTVRPRALAVVRLMTSSNVVGWARMPCASGNNQIVIGEENYILSADGLLMPAKKDQAPPGLRHFKRRRTSSHLGRSDHHEPAR
jgi:hypothetical protein